MFSIPGKRYVNLRVILFDLQYLLNLYFYPVCEVLSKFNSWWSTNEFETSHKHIAHPNRIVYIPHHPPCCFYEKQMLLSNNLRIELSYKNSYYLNKLFLIDFLKELK